MISCRAARVSLRGFCIMPPHGAPHALRRRQADLGRRHRLQPAILAAARHFRARGMTAKGAWRAMKKQPFRTSDGHVAVSNKDQMRHFNGKRKRASIGLKHWQDRYWSAAGEPECGFSR
jgi:hypothetical protein